MPNSRGLRSLPCPIRSSSAPCCGCPILWWRAKNNLPWRSPMQETWAAVDRYFGDRLAPEDKALAACVETNREAGLPSIDVPALLGQFLGLMVRISGARNVLEIGTLGGYSTIWLARALPAGGQVVTLEID